MADTNSVIEKRMWRMPTALVLAETVSDLETLAGGFSPAEKALLESARGFLESSASELDGIGEELREQSPSYKYFELQRHVLRTLSPLQRSILRMYHGLKDGRKHTSSEVARELGTNVTVVENTFVGFGCVLDGLGMLRSQGEARSEKV